MAKLVPMDFIVSLKKIPKILATTP